MPAHINHNAHLSGLNRNLNLHYATAARQIEQLASGKRVNRSSDDPASLALADDINAEVRTLAQGNRNAQQSVQMLQVAEGSLSSMTDIIQRMRELATQSSSDSYRDVDRQGINTEFQSLKQELDRIARSTAYNDIHLLDADTVFSIQSGPSTSNSDVARLDFHDLRTASPRLSIDSLTVTTRASALQAMDQMAVAHQTILDERNRIAAYHNRLSENTTTSASIMERMRVTESAIREADVPAVVGRLTQSQILSQTAVSMAAEANLEIQRILGLLQG